VLGIAVLAAVFSARGGYTTPGAFVEGFVPALTIGAITVAIGAADPTAATHHRHPVDAAQWRPPRDATAEIFHSRSSVRYSACRGVADRLPHVVVGRTGLGERDPELVGRSSVQER
jgi:hypothetical protein